MEEQYTPPATELSDEQLAADIKARAKREAEWQVGPDGIVKGIKFGEPAELGD